MSTNNIALTGESDAVRKTADAILDEDLATINMPNLVFMGTSVSSGTGQAVVFATGLETEFGKIFQLTAGVSEEKSPLMREIDTHVAHRVDPRPRCRRRAVLHGPGARVSTGSGSLLFALGVLVCSRARGAAGDPVGRALGRRAAHGQGARR